MHKVIVKYKIKNKIKMKADLRFGLTQNFQMNKILAKKLNVVINNKNIIMNIFE